MKISNHRGYLALASAVLALSGSAMCVTTLGGGCAAKRARMDRNSWPRYDRGGVPVVKRAVVRDEPVAARDEGASHDPALEAVFDEPAAQAEVASFSQGEAAPEHSIPIASTDPTMPVAVGEPAAQPEALPVVATTIVREASGQAEAPTELTPTRTARPGDDIARALASWSPEHAAPAGVVTLDGDTGEWTDGAVIRADEEHIYVRFMIEDESYTLQSASRTTSILLDADADSATGRKVSLDGAALGVDVEIQLSPAREGSSASRRGAQLVAYDAGGASTIQSPYDWDFAFAPTHASEWYEARISRTPADAGTVARSGMLSRGSVRGVVATLGADGSLDAYSDVFEVSGLPDARASTSDLPIPQRPDGAVRIVSYNVLRSSPVSKPQVFQRVLGALQPDIVLIQEWESTDASQIGAWFDGMLPSAGGWHVRAIADTVQNMGGVAVVSRFPLVGPGGADERVTIEGGRGVRAAFAVAQGPWGPIVLSSVHLKSGGSMGSREDELRVSEALAIRDGIARIGAAHGGAQAGSPGGAWRIVAGDMNLVGSRTPLDVLARGADSDGSDLTPAPSPVWGDGSMLTWSERGNAFTPGRLDWLLYSDSSCQVLQSFALDTSRLSDTVLARLGLTPNDTAEASDHFPVVVDLAPTR